MKKTKQFFVDNIQLGNIVAFNLSITSEKKMLSGRVISLQSPNVKDELVIQTKNGSMFYIKKADVVWVKTGSKWPLGIYNALKYTKTPI